MIRCIEMTSSNLEALAESPHRSLVYKTFLEVYEKSTGDYGMDRATFDAFHEQVGKKWVLSVVAHMAERFSGRNFIENFTIFDIRCAPLLPFTSETRNYGDAAVVELCSYYGSPQTLSYLEKPELSRVEVPKKHKKRREGEAVHYTVKYDDNADNVQTVERTDEPLLSHPQGLAKLKENALREWTGLRQLMGGMKRSSTDNTSTVFKHINTDAGRLAYPTLFKLMGIGLTLPVVSVECERLFSIMKWLKSSLRNRLSDESLNALFLIHNAPEKNLSPSQLKRVLQKFTALKNRVITLDLVSDWDAFMEASNDF